MIHARLGAMAQATTFLRRALATNPHFHLFHADVAQQTLRELEERFTQNASGDRLWAIDGGWYTAY